MHARCFEDTCDVIQNEAVVHGFGVFFADVRQGATGKKLLFLSFDFAGGEQCSSKKFHK